MTDDCASAGETVTALHRWGPLVLATVGVLAWLWPIGLGGKMPVGGDVTQFSIGLMAELARAIHDGRIPFWNDLWGYGFPGLAESQMGVYYLPHLLAYGLLPLEAAYTTLLVAHTLWATWGAYWAARQFGASRGGAAVSGFAFATCGYFLVHLPHQWGASTASWMPWAWGLAWRASRGTCGPRALLWLAAVLAVQILPGHFQLAFITEVTTLVVAAVGFLSTLRESPRRTVRRVFVFGLSLGAVLLLSTMQLAPTAELAGLAREQRTVDYLGAFSSPPTHLISYVAPGLFHQSPLWRPLAWDAFHAMPEEHLATIGLVPLFLAFVSLRRWREPETVGLIVAVLAATAFSLGPYLPGFSLYCQSPGFSFFRAPSRWGAGAMLGLALLAGRGFDVLPQMLRPSRSLWMFLIGASGLLVLVVGTIELAFAATEPAAGKPSMPAVADGLQRAFALLPWDNEPTLAQRMAEMRRPSADSRVSIALARQGITRPTAEDLTLSKSRGAVYRDELGPTVAILVLLAGLSLVAGKRRVFVIGLLAVMLLESGVWSRKRVFELGPIEDLRKQSPVLGELAKLPRGTRSVDSGKNMSMVAGVAPVGAYRTLDLPVLPNVTFLASGAGAESGRAQKLIGVGVVATPNARSSTIVNDPTLLGWLTSEAWAKGMIAQSPNVANVAINRSETEPVRAWFARELPVVTGTRLDEALLQVFDGFVPVQIRSTTPERVTVDFESTEPGTLLVMSLYYPRWRATLNGQPAAVEERFGLQAVKVPEAGRWTLELSYDSTHDRIALGVSGLAWVGWIVLYCLSIRRQKQAAREHA